MTEHQNPHLERSLPYEWQLFEHENETLLCFDRPESLADVYRLLGFETIPRVLIGHDVAIYEGTVVEPAWDDERRAVRLTHEMAATIDSRHPSVFYDVPVPTFEKLSSIDPTDVQQE